MRLYCCALCVLVTPAARAVQTQVEVISGFDRLAQGEPRTTVLRSDGVVTLGSAMRRVKEANLKGQIFDIAEDGRGGVYVASGDPGQVVHIARGKKSRIIFAAKKTLVTALAVDASGAVYASTAPKGALYRVAPGKPQKIYSPKATYIWDLAFDGKDLLMVTGLKGQVLRVTTSGKATPLGKIDEKHLRALAVRRLGSRRVRVVGGGEKGRVYLDAGKGSWRVLYDSALEEITDLAIGDDGAIYVAAVTAEPGVGSEDPEERAKVADSGGDDEPSTREVKGSEVLRIDPGGRVRLLYKSTKDGAYALAVHGRVLSIGTGGRGRLYQVELREPFKLSLAAKLDPGELTALSHRGAQLIIASSAPARLFSASALPVTSGEYLSPVMDAHRTAVWGATRARVLDPTAGQVRLSLRQGNSKKVDDTWSPFVEIGPGPAAKARPQSRYAQIRARLMAVKARAPELIALEQNYRQDNTRPRVAHIELLSPGVRIEPMPDDEPKGRTFSVNPGAFSDFHYKPGKPVQPGEAKARARQTYESGWRTVIWTGVDADGDRLAASVWLQSLSSGAQWLLAQRVRRSFTAFESARMADGLYRIRLVLDDAASNPPENSMQVERFSAPFVVDHRPPVVRDMKARRDGKTVVVEMQVTDATPLRGAWCSQQGQDWQALAAVDGMVDEPSERFVARLPRVPGSTGSLSLRCRVEDRVGNADIAEVRVR